jgi:hypothetical protein
VANASVPNAPAAVPQTFLFDVQQRWSEIAQTALRDGNALLAAELTASTPHLFAHGTLTIAGSAALVARGDSVTLTTIARYIMQVCGHRVQIALRSTAVSDDNNDRRERYRTAEQHPLIQALRKKFQADIVSREPITFEHWQTRQQQKKPTSPETP